MTRSRHMRRLRRSHRLTLLAGVVLAILVVAAALLVRQAPVGRVTAVVNGGRAAPVAPGAFYVRWPGARAISVPDSGRFGFPDDPAYRLFSADGAEIPAVFEVAWRLTDPVALVDFGQSGRGSFEKDVVAAALREAVRPAAGGLEAAAIYNTQGRALVDAVGREIVLPRGVEARITLGRLTMSADAQKAIVSGLARASGRRLLFVGFDACDWKILDELRAEGRAPAFERLIRRGTRADLHTLTPTLSPLLWTSMATGVGPDRHGILDFLITGRNGRKIPVTSAMRRVPAFWNVATHFGRRVDVVGWLATWPAEPISGHMVSDRFSFLAWNAGTTSDSPTPDMVHPPEYLERARSLACRPADITFERVSRFLDIRRAELTGARGAGFRKGNTINNFVLTLATAETYRRIGVSLLRERPDIEAVYFEFLDAMGHMFMPYAPPRQKGISAADFDRYRDAVKVAYIETDRILASLVEAAGDSALVMVASDHGFQSGSSRPAGSAAIEGGQAARWHRDPGVLIVAGPGIRSGAALTRASVLDIAPTLLHLAGLPVSREMEGRVLTDLLTPEELRTHPVRTVDRYVLPPDIWAPPTDAAGGPAGGAVVAGGSADSAGGAGGAGGAPGAEPAGAGGAGGETGGATAAAGPAGRSPGGAATDAASTHVNLGLILEQKGQLAEAEAEYRKALAMSPGDPNALNNLGSVLQKKGRLEEAISLYEKLTRDHPDYAPAFHNLGICHLRRNQPEQAIPWLEKAVSLEPGNVGALVNLGHARLRTGLLDAAEAAFRRALELSPEAANAHFGLGLLAAQKGDPATARREFERTLALDPGHGSARENLERLKNR